MTPRLAPAVLLLALAPLSAQAQQQAAPAPQTLLHLSASASVSATPDQLVADLVAQATSPSAADAQRRVNAAIAAGLQAARGVSGVDARAIGYQVTPSDEKRTNWTAQQTLELRGSDGPALLDLAGRLQGQGLLAAALDWRLTPALRTRVQQDATAQALKQMQDQAAAAASALGLHVDHLRDVRIQANEFVPMMPARALAAPAAAMRAPEATAAPQDVTTTVTAEVALMP